MEMARICVHHHTLNKAKRPVHLRTSHMMLAHLETVMRPPLAYVVAVNKTFPVELDASQDGRASRDQAEYAPNSEFTCSQENMDISILLLYFFLQCARIV